jgi:hypothetical protein
MRKLQTIVLMGLVALAGCGGETSSPTAVSTDDATNLVGAADAGVPMGLGEMGSVTGGAQLQVFSAPGTGLRKLTFSAVQHADGTVSGEWNLVVGATILHGDVDCLNILPGGKVARLAGIVTDAKFTSYQEGTAFALEVHDNGNGLSGDVDETSAVQAFRNAPPEVGRHFCETGEAPADLDFMGLERGNVSIHVVGEVTAP